MSFFPQDSWPGLAAACLTAFLARTFVRFFVSRAIHSSDAYFHLVLIRRIQDHGWHRTATEFQPNYPLGFHWIVSWLPRSWILGWERVSGGILDVLHLLLVVGLVRFASGDSISVIRWELPFLLAFWPAWLFVNMNPRAYYATERPFGEMLLTGVYGALWVFLRTGRWEAWGIAVLLGAFVLNSSKFGAQVLWAFSLILAALERRWEFLPVPVVSSLLALVLSRGVYAGIFRAQLRHLRWYTVALKRGEVTAAKRNSWKTLRSYWAERGLRGAIGYLMNHDSRAIACLHQFPLVAVLALATVGVGRLPVEDRYPWHWLLAGASCWFLTSLRPLLFLGEAERYLVMTAAPAAFVAGHWLETVPRGTGYAPLLGGALLWWFSQQVLLGVLARKANRRTLRADREALYGFLRTLPPSRMLGAGNVLFQRELSFFTPHRSPVTDLGYLGSLSLADLFAKGYFPPRWEAVERLDLELVVIDREQMKKSTDEGYPLDPRFTALPRIFENASYAVHRIKSLAEEPGVSSP